jgi:shikimate dehydrogenase
MPHKEEIASAVDTLDPAAAALASVNTVVLQPDGRSAGYSTDGPGFIASLREAGVDPAGRRIAVIGAGGAARAVIDALARVGAAQVDVVNRSADRAEVAAALAGEQGRVAVPANIEEADIVVNATSIGMGTTELPCDPDLLHDRHVVVDLVYHPIETALLGEARRRGATVVDGLGMLIHQAVLQQQLWTGITPDPEVMRAAAEGELAARVNH